MNGTEYRLADETAIKTRVSEVLLSWKTNSLSGWRYSSIDAETLARIAASSIGCSQTDLRDVELHWIAETIADFASELGLLK